MRFNTSTLLSILVMLLGGLLLWHADAFLGDYQIYIIKLIFINAILALSLNLIYGFTGMFSLGHAGFMAIGAYVAALCVLTPEQKEMMWILEPIMPPFDQLFTPFWPAGSCPPWWRCSLPFRCCVWAMTTWALPRWALRKSFACC